MAIAALRQKKVYEGQLDTLSRRRFAIESQLNAKENEASNQRGA